MKILITAGGTSEKIDEVRCITNHSTGSMGRAVANAFLSDPFTEKIIYICGQAAAAPPEDDKVTVQRITGVSELQSKLYEVLNREKLDVVIHCMAVSDYTVDAVTTTASLAESLMQKLQLTESGVREGKQPFSDLLKQCLKQENLVAKGGKISSDSDGLLLALKRTPKIIDLFKVLQPQTVLVGFKLLDHVPAGTLIEAGKQLMARSRCDFVLANDKADVAEDRHKGYLIQPDGSFESISGRQDIADRIVSCVTERLPERGKPQ